MLAAILTLCGTGAALTACQNANDNKSEAIQEQQVNETKVQHETNKPITDGNYDQSLAVKCINGTFVGKKSENIISYKGIPFVGKQPVGDLRWKAPVDVVPDDGVYEAYHFENGSCQDPSFIEYQG